MKSKSDRIAYLMSVEENNKPKKKSESIEWFLILILTIVFVYRTYFSGA